MKSVNQIYDNILKRILQTPVTTPREVLYMETGLVDIETLIKKKGKYDEKIKGKHE